MRRVERIWTNGRQGSVRVEIEQTGSGRGRKEDRQRVDRS